MHNTWPKTMTNHKYNLLLVLLIISVIVGSGCQSPHEAAKVSVESGNLDIVLDDPQWREQLAFWLDIGYTEGDVTASFASISPDILRQPNLYATYGAVGILTQLGEEVQNPQAIGMWVESLRNEQGAYDDPLNEFPLIVETYWAVATLNRLGIAPHNSEETVAFIRSLQRDDGFFVPDLSLGGPEEEQNLVATRFAINTLFALRTTLANEMLQKGAKALAAYLTSHLAGVSPDLTNKKATYFIGAARSLAEIDPSIMPEDVQLFLQRAVDKVPSLPENPLAAGFVNDLLDAVDLVELSEAETSPGSLSHYVTERVLPSLTIQGGYEFVPGSLDPILTYEAIKLVRRVGVSFPRSDDLLQNIGRYRIEDGWITFVVPRSNPQSTYCALAIAQQIDYDRYDPAKVGAYLKQFIQPEEEMLSLTDVYFALLGLALLGQEPDEQTLQSLREVAISKMQRLPEDDDASDELLAFALLAKTLNWELPASLRERIVQAIRQEGAVAVTYGIERIHRLTILQLVAGEEIIPPEKIYEDVWALLSNEGGFKAVTYAPAPDLRATLLALQTLSYIHRINAVDQEAVVNFVLSCKSDYGFTYVPLYLIEQSPEDSGVDSDLFVTREGLAILTMFSREPEY